MSSGIFREKSLKKVQSPEDLNDYVRVANPGIWLLVIAVLLLLAGALCWGFWGHIESSLEVSAIASGSTATCYVPVYDLGSVSVGMPVRLEDTEGEITEIGTPQFPQDMPETEELDFYWAGIDMRYAPVTVRIDVPEGIYTARIITESIRPISLILG